MKTKKPVLVPKWDHKLTRQDTFNRAWEWAKTHDYCFDSRHCLYRSEDNTNACLIGCCVPDSRRKAVSARATVSQIWDQIRSVFAKDVELAFLIHLQSVHDNCVIGQLDEPTSKRDYKQRLREFARQQDLKVPITKRV